jgi:hypothetical protein
MSEPATGTSAPRSLVAPPPLFQLGYVPQNLEHALKYWTDHMGVGPFFRIPHVHYDTFTYRGQPGGVDNTIYISWWGDVQIELVEQHCDSPTIYRDALIAGEDGLQHVCYLVEDLEAARAECVQRGGEVVQEMTYSGGGIFYVDYGGGPGSIVEIFKAPPYTLPAFEKMKAAAARWDGSNPVRDVRMG